MTLFEISLKYGFNKEEEQSYLDYVSNKFEQNKLDIEPDDHFLERWRMILEFSKKNSMEEAWNLFVSPKYPIEFKKTTELHMEIYPSFAGEIPVIYVSDVDDFENMVTNIVYKGIRPENISKIGASFVFGKATRFIILSLKPYSNVLASELGLEEEEWAKKSIIIRREHECTHYYTKQFFGGARNCLHDELIADFFGIYEAFHCYKADYFMHFIGAKGSRGDRLKVYTQGLSQNVYEAIKETAVCAANILEKWSISEEFLKMTRRQRVDRLCCIGLKGILENLVL